MRKIRMLLVLGFLVSVLPYLGFPLFIKNLLISVAGLTIVYFSYFLYNQNKKALGGKPQYENFSENNDFIESEINEVVEEKINNDNLSQ